MNRTNWISQLTIELEEPQFCRSCMDTSRPHYTSVQNILYTKITTSIQVFFYVLADSYVGWKFTSISLLNAFRVSFSAPYGVIFKSVWYVFQVEPFCSRKLHYRNVSIESTSLQFFSPFHTRKTLIDIRQFRMKASSSSLLCFCREKVPFTYFIISEMGYSDTPVSSNWKQTMDGVSWIGTCGNFDRG